MGISRIGLARSLIGLAFLATLLSLRETASHVWDPEYFVPALADGPQHARFHFLRELTGDVGKIVAVAIILLQPPRLRMPVLWWIMLVHVGTYQGGFWVGYPVLGVGAPNVPARVVHTLATALGLAGVLVARACYSSHPEQDGARPR
jgi:hypothetical protein